VVKRAFISGGAPFALSLAALIGTGCSTSDSPGPAGGGPGVSPGVITVAGRVVGQNGRGMAGVPVVITGKPSATSDENGSFMIPDVNPPYDISVVDAASRAVLVYKGLERPDPTLLFIGVNPGTAHAGSINGNVSGGAFTPDQGSYDVTRVVFSSLEATGVTITGAGGTFGPLNLRWFGPAVTTGTLYALQFTVDGDGFPVASGYRGFGLRSGIAVEDGTALNSQYDTLQSVSTSQFTGTVSVPSGYTLFAKVAYVRVAPTALIQLIADTSPGTTVSYYTPGIPGATLLIGAEIVRAGGGTGILWKDGIAVPSTGIPIEPGTPPELNFPVNGAAGIDTTVVFSWTPMAGGVHLVRFQGSGGNPAYYILTAGTSVTIPSMSPFGLGLPAGALYRWTVLAFGPFFSADAAAGPAGFAAGLTGPPVASNGDVFVGQSATRLFTTPP